MMDAEAMRKALSGIPEGTLLFVSYEAGREPTDRAIREASRHTTNPTRPRRSYVGTFVGVRRTKKSDLVMTIFAHNRDTESGGSLREGGYRTFNPAVGSLLRIEVLS